MTTFLEGVERRLRSLCSGSNHRGDLSEVRELMAKLGIAQHATVSEVLEQAPTAWFNFLNFDKDRNLRYKDRPAQICTLACILSILENNRNQAKKGFEDSGKWFERSLVELKLRLIGRLYKYSRRVWKEYSNKNDAIACVEYALSIAELTELEVGLLSDYQQRTLFGFRGAMREFLARFNPNTEISY